MEPTRTKFVIFTASRSGSTAFAQALDTHRDVFCYQHPFNPQMHTFQRFANIPAQKVDIQSRHSDPVKFVQDLHNHSRRRAAVGFKIWPLQDVPACSEAIAYLAGDTDVKKIILQRQNQLASYSSRLLVRLKRTSTPAPETPNQRLTAAFCKQDFANFLERRTAWVTSRLELSKGDVLHLTYEGMMREGLQRAAVFLDLSKPHDFYQTQRKRNSNDILGRFDVVDHPEILRFLDQIGHPEWVSEGA